MSNPINGCADIEARIAEQLPTEISIVWHVEDVLAIDSSLTYDQARLVLQRLKMRHDATRGDNWWVMEYETIAYIVDAMRRLGEL